MLTASDQYFWVIFKKVGIGLNRFYDYTLTVPSSSIIFKVKELSFCHKLWFSNPYIIVSPNLFDFDYIKLNSAMMKYFKLEISKVYPSTCKDV